MVIEVTFDVTDVYISTTVSPVYVNVSFEAPSSGGGTWGSITGTLSNQTDLQNALNAKFDDPTGTTSHYLRGDGSLATFPAIPSGTVQSVGLSMPSAFSVANSPITSSGTLAVTGAGTSAQYIRGDGQLANFPSGGGGGSSFNYYLNGSVNQGTFGGTVYYEMSKTPVLGAGTNFTRTNAQGNGYIASFITDAGDPSLLNIPAGNWTLEFYFQSSSSGGSPQFYGELYKVSSADVFTLVASGSTNPERITNGTSVDQYFTSIPVPQTSLLVTDRLAIRIYVITSDKTITLHTENSNLCEILTTFSTGLNALNGLTAQVQYFATGTSGTDFGISSATDTHTFNLPTASSVNRGALSSADWTTFNSKQNALGYTAANAATTLTINGVTFDLSANRTFTVGSVTGSGASGQVAYWTGTSAQSGSNDLFWDSANGRLGIGTVTPSFTFHVSGANAGIFLTRTAPDESFIVLSNTTFTSGGQIRGFSSGSGMRFTNQNGTTEWARFNVNTGNFQINTGATDTGQRLQVQGTTLLNGNVTFSSSTGMFWDATNSRLGIGTNAPDKRLHIKGDTTSSDIVFETTSYTTKGYFAHYQGATLQLAINRRIDGVFSNTGAASASINVIALNNAGYINFFATNTNNSTPNEIMRINGTGNVLIQNGGTFTDSGERLQVTGTMKVTGLSTFGESLTISKNSNAVLGLIISNTTAGTGSNPYLQLVSDATAGSAQVFKYSSTRTPYKTIAASDFGHYNATAGDISFLNDFASGAIKFAAGGSSTVHMTIKSNGRINMSSLPTSSSGLATGDLWNDAGTIKIV